jgi:hypothetical protein
VKLAAAALGLLSLIPWLSHEIADMLAILDSDLDGIED